MSAAFGRAGWRGRSAAAVGGEVTSSEEEERKQNV